MLAVDSQEIFRPGNELTSVAPPGPDIFGAPSSAPSPTLTAGGPAVTTQPVQPPSLNSTGGSAAAPSAPTMPAPTAPYEAPQGPASQYSDELFNQPITPVRDQVTPEQTVQGQLTSLLDRNNPLMEQARERAKRMMAGRGLQNTTMAGQAGEQAFISQALPIAQQDAARYGQASSQNAAAENAFGMSQQQFAQQMEVAKQRFGFETSLSSQQAYQRLQELAAQGDQEARLALLNFGFQRDLTVLQGQIARDQANLDFANRLIELSTQGDIQSKLQLEQFGFNTQLSAQENVQRLQQLARQGDINASLQLQQFQFQSLLSSQEHGQTIALEDSRFQNNQNLMLLEFQQRGVLSGQEAQQQLEYLNQQHLYTLEQIQAQVQAQMTGDAAAAGRSLQNNYLLGVADRQRATSAEIAQIYSTQGLSAAQQNQAVQNAYARLQQDLLMLRTYYQQSPMWDPNFGGAPTGPSGTLPPPGMPGGPPVAGTPVPSGGDFWDRAREIINARNYVIPPQP